MSKETSKYLRLVTPFLIVATLITILGACGTGEADRFYKYGRERWVADRIHGGFPSIIQGGEDEVSWYLTDVPLNDDEGLALKRLFESSSSGLREKYARAFIMGYAEAMEEYANSTEGQAARIFWDRQAELGKKMLLHKQAVLEAGSVTPDTLEFVEEIMQNPDRRDRNVLVELLITMGKVSDSGKALASQIAGRCVAEESGGEKDYWTSILEIIDQQNPRGGSD